MTKALAVLAAASLNFVLLTATAADAPAPDQQQRVRECAVQSQQVPQDHRQDFVDACVGGATKKSTVAPSQRAAVCDSIANSEGFKGEERTRFVENCNKA